MTKTELAKLKEEAIAEYLQEQKQKRQNGKVFSKVLAEFEEDFKKFDWADCRTYTTPWYPNGKIFEYTQCEAYSVKAALGKIAKAIFKTKTVGSISFDKEEQIRKMIRSILDVLVENV